MTSISRRKSAKRSILKRSKRSKHATKNRSKYVTKRTRSKTNKKNSKHQQTRSKRYQSKTRKTHSKKKNYSSQIKKQSPYNSPYVFDSFLYHLGYQNINLLRQQQEEQPRQQQQQQQPRQPRRQQNLRQQQQEALDRQQAQQQEQQEVLARRQQQEALDRQQQVRQQEQEKSQSSSISTTTPSNNDENEVLNSGFGTLPEVLENKNNTANTNDNREKTVETSSSVKYPSIPNSPSSSPPGLSSSTPFPPSRQWRSESSIAQTSSSTFPASIAPELQEQINGVPLMNQTTTTEQTTSSADLKSSDSEEPQQNQPKLPKTFAYLSSNVNLNKLKVDDIKRILFQHSVQLPNNQQKYNKQDLLKILKSNLVEHRDEWINELYKPNGVYTEELLRILSEMEMKYPRYAVTESLMLSELFDNDVAYIIPEVFYSTMENLCALNVLHASKSLDGEFNWGMAVNWKEKRDKAKKTAKRNGGDSLWLEKFIKELLQSVGRKKQD